MSFSARAGASCWGQGDLTCIIVMGEFWVADVIFFVLNVGVNLEELIS